MTKPERRRQTVEELLLDVMQAHADKRSNDYNECDDDPCAWCQDAKSYLDEREHPLVVMTSCIASHLYTVLKKAFRHIAHDTTLASTISLRFTGMHLEVAVTLGDFRPERIPSCPGVAMLGYAKTSFPIYDFSAGVTLYAPQVEHILSVLRRMKHGATAEIVFTSDKVTVREMQQ